MDLLVDLLLVSLSVSVQLGVPVVVLFVAGYLARRKSNRRQDPCLPLDDDAEPATIAPAAKRTPAADAAERPAWECRRCPPADLTHASLPCWQAVKTDRGGLRSECLDCRLFLTPARRG